MPSRPPRRTPWARLLMRTLKVDGLDGPRCHARMVLLALITAPHSLERILSHFDLPAHPPPIAPARLDPQTDLTLHGSPPDDAYLHEPQRERGRQAASRAPP